MTALTSAPIATERLTLRLITRAEAADMREGRRHGDWDPDFPREDDIDGASMILADDDPWGSRHIVRDGLSVGSIGFFGPPTDIAGVAEVEVGYGLVASARGIGLATEAVRAMVVAAEAAGARVRASVEPANAPSIRVLSKAGFTELRGTSEGGELVMVRPRA